MATISTDKRFDKIDAQLDHIATALLKGFDSVNVALHTKASSEDLHTALDLLDSLMKQQEISDDERLVMSHQLAQLHTWVEAAAKRIGLEFSH